MTHQENQSRDCLDRNTPEAQSEAAKLLNWSWSARATELLTRYPRRGAPYSVLTVDKVDELNLQLRHPSKFFAEFQAELGGVTYRAHGEDGGWATWGLTSLENPEDDDEWNGPDIHDCYTPSAGSIEGYCLSGDGQLWGEFPEAQTVSVEIERIAAKLELSALYKRSVAIWLSARVFNIERLTFLPVLDSVFIGMNWSIIPETQDVYSCIWRGSLGWAYYSSAYESDKHLFFFGAFVNTDEEMFFKERLDTFLPDYDIHY